MENLFRIFARISQEFLKIIKKQVRSLNNIAKEFDGVCDARNELETGYYKTS